MVQRMLGAERISARALHFEVGIAQSTLSKWARDRRKISGMNNKKKNTHQKSPRQWTAEEKLKVVLEAASISDEDLGAFLRSKGLHEAQLKEWHELATRAAEEALSNHKKKSGRKTTSETKKIKELERDLRRKEKAMAEMAALITLQKKMREIWGDADDDTPTRSGS